MSLTCKPKCKKAQAVVCIVINVVLTLNFLVLITIWAFVRASFPSLHESSTCIPCDKVASKANKNSGQERAYSAIQMREDGLCCGPVKQMAWMVFLKEMATQYYDYRQNGQSLLDILDESLLADCERETNNKQPFSKVVGIVDFTPSYIVDGHHKLLWNKNGRTFYSNNCVHLELEGEIFVRQPGYYMVSSQLNLRRRMETSTTINETRPTTFVHHVDLLSHKYGTTGVLMQTKKSIEGKCVYHTSFLSAIFKLNKNDRLSVSVSHPELLDIDNPNDHFLVYYTYDLPL
ncbi:uncharacterized protein LOC128223065 [Mya arenaria]|uniref:uncharacterized protein LOC128223065 n=1 Tax=Mya arenaria TaxID=6604 RepID=UPI0022E52ED9|nr:uncharacterized protein LOC128223065 [Mya arenaria]